MGSIVSSTTPVAMDSKKAVVEKVANAVGMMNTITSNNVSFADKKNVIDNYGLDDANRKAAYALAQGGEKAFHKHVFTGTNPDGTERQLSYSEMRSLYG